MWLQQMRAAVSAADTVNRDDESGRGRTHHLSTAAVTRYDRYRQQAGIPITARHNLAKRVRP